MTTPTDIGPDPTFEDEVRAMLARRAGDVDPDALAPGLPEGVRIALVDERSARRRPARWLTAAAVVVVLAAAGALVLRDEGGPTEEAATATTGTTTARGWSDSTAVIPDLPAGIGPAHLFPLWDPGAEGADLDPMEVADQYLADRIGDGWGAFAATDHANGLATVTWGAGEDAEWTAALGQVHLERRDGRWQVIAATAPETFDVADARLAAGRLQGTMANRGTQRWGVEIGPADRTASVQELAGLVLGMPDDCSSPCAQDTSTYIAMPELAAAGGSAVPVEASPVGEPLAPEPHRLQAVTVRDDVSLTGGEDPQPTAPPALAFTEIVFDPAVPPVEAGGEPEAEGRPAHLASLPLGVDPTVGPVRTVEAWGATPEAAAEDLATDAFGSADGVLGEPFAFEGSDPDGLWAAEWSPVVDLDPAAWPADRAGDVGGTVTVRRQDGGGWTAVAATSAALDLTGVRYSAADGGLRGEVKATVPAPLLVTVQTLAGEELATSALTTFTPDGQRSSVLPLDDLLETTDGQPLLLRVTAGDRPGQVGLDGVGVAAYASVVLPGWSEGSGGVPTTTG